MNERKIILTLNNKKETINVLIKMLSDDFRKEEVEKCE